MKFVIGMGDKRKLAIFCQFVENIKNICEFITFHFNESDIYSQGMSGDHCSIFEITINSEWFELYQKDENDANIITLRTSTLAKILDTRQKSQFLVVEYKGEPNKLNIKLKNKPKDQVKDEYPKEFELPLINIDHELMNVPDKEYSVEFNICSTKFRNIIEQLLLFDSVISINCDEETIRFQSNGEDGALTVNLFDEKNKYIDEFLIEEEYNFKSDFDAKHLYNFCKFSKLAKNISLGFTNDYPMRMSYLMDDENIKLIFLLAPRIKEDE